MIISVMVVVPAAFAEDPKSLSGYSNTFVGGTLFFEQEEFGVLKRSLHETGKEFLSKSSHLESLFMLQQGSTGSWTDDTGIELLDPLTRLGLSLEEPVISDPMRPPNANSFKNTGILVGLRYTFSHFTWHDFKKAIAAFGGNAHLAPSQGAEQVSFYVAVSDF